MDANARAGDASTIEVEVDWGDCDPADIVFYPNYFAWLDRATWRLFSRVGLDRDRLVGEFGLGGFPLVKAGLAFFNPAFPGDVLVITSRVARWGASSFTVEHRIAKRDGALVAEGAETRVWVAHDRSAEKRIVGRRIPDVVVRMMGGARADERS